MQPDLNDAALEAIYERPGKDDWIPCPPDAWATLRIILGNAVREEVLARNVAGLVRTPASRSRKAKPWTVEEARQFLESAKSDRDPLYAAYVLILVLGLRRGEVLGLPWAEVDLDGGELHISWQRKMLQEDQARWKPSGRSPPGCDHGFETSSGSRACR